MSASGAAIPVSPPSRAVASAREVATAFMLPPDMFELIYGDECLRAIGAESRLLADRPLGPHHDAALWLGTMADAEVVFTGWNSPPFDDALLTRLPRLRAVFHGGGTLRPYVTEAFWNRGIAVATAASANAVPVAEYTLGAILLSLKRAWALNRQIRRERAFPAVLPPVPGAHGSTVGLVSLGLIGREVLRRLQQFDVRIVAHDPHLPDGRFRELGVEALPLDELMACSDVVSLHTPLHSETEGLIDGALLGRLKPGATFINTARGGLVREPELITFLRSRPDVQAILDVTSPEPPVAGSALYELPNVFLTPHIAGSLGAECRRMGWAMVSEFRRYVRREPLHHSVSRELASRQT